MDQPQARLHREPTRRRWRLDTGALVMGGCGRRPPLLTALAVIGSPSPRPLAEAPLPRSPASVRPRPRCRLPRSPVAAVRQRGGTRPVRQVHARARRLELPRAGFPRGAGCHQGVQGPGLSERVLPGFVLFTHRLLPPFQALGFGWRKRTLSRLPTISLRRPTSSSRQ